MSEDDEGVFFGTHDPREIVLLAELSARSTPLRKPLAPLRKRDSREFLRRQTLLFSAKSSEAFGSKHERTWPGGFYAENARPLLDEQQSDVEVTPRHTASINVTSPKSPKLSRQHCDLTLDFANFRLSDVECVTPGGMFTEGADEEDYGGSDKENEATSTCQASSMLYQQHEVVSDLMSEGMGDTESNTDGTRTTHFVTTGGLMSVQELDMGGLKLNDLGDAETLVEEEIVSETVDLGEMSDDGTESIERVASLGYSPTMSGSKAEPLSNPAPCVSTQTFDGDLGVLAESADSPIPMTRAGPVIIPEVASHLAISMRAESGSPYRSLPPRSLPSSSFPELAQDTRLTLSLLESSPQQAMRKFSQVDSANRTANGPKALSESRPESRHASAGPQSTSISSASSTKSARLTIRGQLDNAFVGRFGPPQRSAPGPSTVSTVFNTAKPVGKDRAKYPVTSSAGSTLAMKRKLPTPPMDPKRSMISPPLRAPLIARAIPVPTQTVRRFASQQNASADLTRRPIGNQAASRSLDQPAHSTNGTKHTKFSVPAARSLNATGGPSRNGFSLTKQPMLAAHSICTFGDLRAAPKSPFQRREANSQQAKKVSLGIHAIAKCSWYHQPRASRQVASGLLLWERVGLRNSRRHWARYPWTWMVTLPMR